jgi:tetratricopeptide (TPR) repeat protein
VIGLPERKAKGVEMKRIMRTRLVSQENTVYRTASTVVLVVSFLFVIPNTSRAADAPAADTLLADARKALADRDGRLALKFADKAVAVDPSNAKARLFRADLLDASGKVEEALADYDKLVELQPQNARAYQGRGIARFKLGRFKESVADVDKELEIQPANKPHHWQRGIALYYAGDFKAGREQFELHKTVTRPTSRTQRGTSCASRG